MKTTFELEQRSPRPTISVAPLLVLLCVACMNVSANADVAAISRAQIEQGLINNYARESREPAIIDYTIQLERNDSVQPIRVVHARELIARDRVLILSLDDGAREVFPGADDTVVIGIPFADRIRDLTPGFAEPPTEGTPEYANTRVTTPASEDFITFIKNSILPWAEKEFGPFHHRVLFGYSYGGIFTIQSMLQEPELFHSYIAGSPSLWYRYDFYEGAAIKAQSYADKFAGRCLIMSAGEDEPTINSNTRKFQTLLTGITLPLIMHYQRNIEVDHSHNRMVSFLYGWDKIFNMDDEFPPANAIAATSLDEFNQFVRQWSREHSCAPFSVARSSAAYTAFARKLTKQENWAELKALHEYVLANVPVDSDSYGPFLGPMLSGFSKFPEQDKPYWASAYLALMATNPLPGLAVHFINMDILEYLDTQGASDEKFK